MPATTGSADLYCSDTLVTEGDWRGVDLNYLLQQAGPESNAALVSFEAQDGYKVSIPLSEVLNPNAIIAYEKDGSPLPESLRLVLLGENGNLWVKMITSIVTIGSAAKVDQQTNASTSLGGLSSTQQRQPVQPQFQPASPIFVNGTGTAESPANVSLSPQKASSTQGSGTDGLRIASVVASGTMLAAFVASMAASYVTRKRGRPSRTGAKTS
jgi:DMSO/TMAO reductase YedYZ molybdopterin-dependent catalytic subunit